MLFAKPHRWYSEHKIAFQIFNLYLEFSWEIRKLCIVRPELLWAMPHGNARNRYVHCANVAAQESSNGRSNTSKYSVIFIIIKSPVLVPRHSVYLYLYLLLTVLLWCARILALQRLDKVVLVLVCYAVQFGCFSASTAATNVQVSWLV